MKFALLFITIILSLNAFSATKYQQMKNDLQKIQRANNTLVQIFQLGLNDQGDAIDGIKISGNNFNTTNPNQLVVGTHHGNEAKSVNVSIAFIDRVLEVLKDTSHPYYTKFQRTTFHVIPVLNISGYNKNSRSETAANGNRYDPNRDYPDACYEGARYNLKSTKLLSNYIKAKNIIGSITVHGYIGTFTFPWGTYALNTHSPDHQRFQNWATEAAVHNNYKIGTHSDVIYPATGSFEDWAYHELGVWSMLLELQRYPDYLDDSKMMISFFSNVPDYRSTDHAHGACRRDLSREELERARP